MGQWDAEQRAAEVASLRKIEEDHGPASFDAALAGYRVHPSDELRRDVWALVRERLLAAPFPARRQRLTLLLLRAARDEQERWVRDAMLSWLLQLTPAEFGDDARNVIDELPRSDPDVLRLIGLSGYEACMPELRRLTEGPVPWSALLSQARLGDVKAAARVVQQVEAEEDVVDRSGLFKDLAFTRQPVALDALRRFLGSDQRLPRIKDHVPGTLEAMYAAQALALAVEECPVAEATSEADLAAVRAWAVAQTAWKVKP